MNGFSHYAVSIGQFYYFLKRINVFTYEQAAFGSVYLSLKDHKLVDDKAFEIINEAFENAKNGVCKLEKCSIKHDQIEKPYKKFCFDFLFNLVLQIGAYSIYSDGVDAQFLTDSVERLKEEAKYYLENVIEGIPIELPDIDAYSFVPNCICQYQIRSVYRCEFRSVFKK